MGSVFESISSEHEAFMKEQHMFFVGTAAPDGHVNLSPKGYDFEHIPGARQIIAADIESVKTSCGFSIPYYTYEGERTTLVKWAQDKGADGLEKYWKQKNIVSMDGITTPLGKLLRDPE